MLWAVYLTLITILSSVIPAKTASGIDVKNALAYE
jgi:ABC-type lipoprotein release transport system permease subunit